MTPPHGRHVRHCGLVHLQHLLPLLPVQTRPALLRPAAVVIVVVVAAASAICHQDTGELLLASIAQPHHQMRRQARSGVHAGIGMDVLAR